MIDNSKEEILKTVEFCLKAVKNDAEVLQDVPDELKSTEMCFEAVKNDAEVLRFVPEKYRTQEILYEITMHEDFFKL